MAVEVAEDRLVAVACEVMALIHDDETEVVTTPTGPARLPHQRLHAGHDHGGCLRGAASGPLHVGGDAGGRMELFDRLTDQLLAMGEDEGALRLEICGKLRENSSFSPARGKDQELTVELAEARVDGTPGFLLIGPQRKEIRKDCRWHGFLLSPGSRP